MTARLGRTAPVWRPFKGLVLLAAAIACAPEAARAASALLDAGGFETYSAGNLAGQQGWASIGGAGAAFVQTSVVKSGSKAVRVDRAAGDGSYWAVQFADAQPLPTNRFILVDWDMRVAGTGATDGRLGPFFGVESYDYLQGPLETPPGRLGTFGVDATTGELLYLKSDPAGAVLEVVPDETIVFNTWNHFALLYDFTLKKYSTFLNGVHLLTTDFADPGLNQFTDADISTFAAAADSGSVALTGTAFFDNFRIFNGIPGDFDNDGDVDGADLASWRSAFKTTAVGDADGDSDSDGADFLIWQRNLGADLLPAVAAGAAVPEPASAAAFALGSLMLACRCRRHAARGN